MEKKKKKRHEQLPEALKEHRSEPCKHLGKSIGKKCQILGILGAINALNNKLYGIPQVLFSKQIKISSLEKYFLSFLMQCLKEHLPLGNDISVWRAS